MSLELTYPDVDELRGQINCLQQRIQDLTMARDDAPDRRRPYYDQEIERLGDEVRRLRQAYDAAYGQMQTKKC